MICFAILFFCVRNKIVFCLKKKTENKSWLNGWCSVAVVAVCMFGVDECRLGCNLRIWITAHIKWWASDTKTNIWKFENEKASGRMYVRDEINEMNGVSNKNERIKTKTGFCFSFWRKALYRDALHYIFLLSTTSALFSNTRGFVLICRSGVCFILLPWFHY